MGSVTPLGNLHPSLKMSTHFCKELQGLRANLFSELADMLDILILQVFFRETTIGFDQALSEIDRSIAHQALYLIQHRPDLLPRESRVIKKRNKVVNGLLKID